MPYIFFQAEDGIRVLVRSRGLGDGYKRQGYQRNDKRGKRRCIERGRVQWPDGNPVSVCQSKGAG